MAERLVPEEQMAELVGLFREVSRRAARANSEAAENTESGPDRSGDSPEGGTDGTDERDGGTD